MNELFRKRQEEISVRFEKQILFIYNYVYPFVGFPLLIWLWYREVGLEVTLLVMGLPLVFGYLVPGIGTNLLKKWRFKGRWIVGDYFIHHGFIYASTMGLALYLGFFPTTAQGSAFLWGNMARTAALVGFGGWWHDLLAVRHGMIEIYNGPWQRGAVPEVIVAHYAPICFSLLGAAYAGIVTLGQRLLSAPGGASHLGWLFLAGLMVMTMAVSLPYLLLEKR